MPPPNPPKPVEFTADALTELAAATAGNTDGSFSTATDTFFFFMFGTDSKDGKFDIGVVEKAAIEEGMIVLPVDDAGQIIPVMAGATYSKPNKFTAGSDVYYASVGEYSDGAGLYFWQQ